MKARIVTEHGANPLTTAPEYSDKLVPVTKVSRGQKKIEFVWPVGLEIEGQKALELVLFGLAEPLDAECAEACGMDATQLAAAQINQEMAQKGVHDKKDQELYRAGVIVGYKPKAGGGLEYDWGPNAAAYKAELAKLKSKDEDDGQGS